MARMYVQPTKPRDGQLPEAVAAPLVQMASPFKGFRPEREVSLHPVQHQDQKLEQIIEAWRLTLQPTPKGLSDYEFAVQSVRDINCSNYDLGTFVTILPALWQQALPSFLGGVLMDTSSYFISALINYGSDSAYTVDVRLLGKLDYLCTHNTKDVVITGNVGVYVGNKMTGGKLTINGNAEQYAGSFISGGVLTITGNACNYAAQGMSGGTFIVNGNVRQEAGRWMTDGEIIIGGNADIYVGHEMGGGTITIEGNAGRDAGSMMTGGELKILGNAGGYTGRSMKGGKITIGRNAKTHLGHHMHDGEIVLEGNATGYAGDGMHGGILAIKGNASDNCGSNMRGGRLIVFGNAGIHVGDFMKGGDLVIRGNGLGARGMTGGSLTIGDRIRVGMPCDSVQVYPPLIPRVF